MYGTIQYIDLHHTTAAELIQHYIYCISQYTKHRTQNTEHSTQYTVDPMNIPSLFRFPAI